MGWGRGDRNGEKEGKEGEIGREVVCVRKSVS